MKPQLIRHRRPLAALCAAAAVLLVRLPPQAGAPGGPVLVAAGDLAAGTRPAPADVRTIRMRPPPAGALSRLPAGAVLAAPVRRGEPLTDLRLLGPSLLDGHGPGSVAAPVRVADAALASLVRPGDRVDVLAVSDGAASFSPARPLVTAAPVLAVPPAAGAPGALLLLAVSRAEAAALAVASPLTVSLCPPADPGPGF